MVFMYCKIKLDLAFNNVKPKDRVGWGGVGGPCDYCVSPSPFGLDFGTLDFGTLDLGLTISHSFLV